MEFIFVELEEQAQKGIENAIIAHSYVLSVFFNLEETLERYRSLSQEIAREVENFHPYIYDSLADPVTHIRDGGRDMYDFGNMVSNI